MIWPFKNSARRRVAAAQCMWSKGTIAWVLANIRPLTKPFPVKGQLGLFKIEVPEGAI